MRITGGDFKGKKLSTPNDYSIRPTSDKVKEAIFNMLMWDIDDAVCADVFCGCGSLGLEAVSRGARFCYFFDNSKVSLALTKKNIIACGAAEKAELIAGDFKKTIMTMKQKPDIIFLDPPYEKGMLVKAIESISENNLLEDDGLIVAEHSKMEILPDDLCGFKKIKDKRYGMVAVSI